MKTPAGPLGVQSLAGGAERRELTILFADLAGSTEILNRLDPEDFHGFIHAFLDLCERCVSEAGGLVARYMGDGILAYFGYPKAQEDDARRAAAAALALHGAAAGLRTPDGAPLTVRVGVATGPTIVGDLIGSGAAQERMVVGQAAVLAARLQAAAQPGELLVCQRTHAALSDHFACEPAGPYALKGFEQPIPAWKVVRAAGRAVRPRGPPEGAVDFVGREAEVAALQSAFADAARGRLQIAWVSGEAGIGKSSLVAELRRRLGPEATWLSGGGASMYANTPFYPVAELLSGWLAADGAPWPPDATSRLRDLAGGPAADEAAALVADLLEIPPETERAPSPLSAEARRAGLLAALERMLLGLARDGPAVIVVEDLHWLDPSTLELLSRLARRSRRARLLLILTSRDDAPMPGASLGIRLTPLDPAAVRRLVENVAGGRLSPATIERVAMRSEGVPLFAEELARLVRDDGGAWTPAVPSTLRSLLTARLDSAGPAKTVAHMAAVLGAEFDQAALRTMSDLSAAQLAAHLRTLVAQGVLVRRGERAGAYAFRHALLRDVAYEAILREPRRRLHARAAVTMAGGSAGGMAGDELAAQHWDQAGEPERAFTAWTSAGSAAFGRHAFGEAQHAFERALAALDRADPPDRDRRELELQGELASLLQITRGYSAPETMAATAQARRLAERHGDLDKQVSQLANGWIAASSQGAYRQAAQLGLQLMPLAIADGRPERIGVAAMMQLTSRYRMGDLHAAEEVYLGARRAFAHRRFQRQPGASPQTFGNAAIIAWLLGKPGEARRRLARAQAISARKNVPYETAFTQFMCAAVDLLMDDPGAAEAKATAALGLADLHGFPQFSATCRVLAGAARLRQGAGVAALDLIREGLAAMEANGSRAGITMYLAWLAEGLRRSGRADEAVATLDRALREHPEERFFEPELRRLMAEARRDLGDLSGARREALDAIRAARAMGARALYLRAVEAQARL